MLKFKWMKFLLSKQIKYKLSAIYPSSKEQLAEHLFCVIIV